MHQQGHVRSPLREILDAKGRTVFTVSRDATAAHAVALMNRCRIGSVVVVDDGAVEGIFTERDVLVRVVEPNRDPARTTVAEVMSAHPTCATPSTTVGSAMEIMTAHRQRHLPVCDAGVLVGLVSLGDLVHHLSRGLEQQVSDLTRFVHGPYAMPSDAPPSDSLLPSPPWEAVSADPAVAS